MKCACSTATRAQSRVPGSGGGNGPAIRIPGVANFGGPVAGAADAGFGFTENIFQVLDNVTYIRGDHAFKVGLAGQFVDDTRTQTQFQLYTFPSVAAYQSARSGANPFAYTNFQQFFGEPSFDYGTNMWAFFAQDDWRLSSDFKLLYGLRYDVYAPAEGVQDALIESSRSFETDQNNLQPRAGFVWTLGEDRRTVLRGNTGLMYDQPINAIYEQAIVNDGSTRRGSATLQPTQPGAPLFPNVLSGGSAAASNTAWTVDPDFQIARMWQSNVQLEHAIGEVYAAAIGLWYTRGYDLPIVTNVNLINPIGTLPDGRAIWSTAINAATRRDPRFNAIFATQSIAESDYKGLTLQFTRRYHRGVQWDLAYTLGKSEDNAPGHGTTLHVQGDTGGRSDMADLDVDRGPNILDQRHTFVGSIVAQPQLEVEGVAGHILNDNQFGIALQFASGIPVNVRANRDLNNDGIANSDRPNGVGRNSLNLPARYNVDLRYSRLFPIARGARAEVIAELKNIFNRVQWSGANSVVTVDAVGNAAAPIPSSGDGFAATGGYEQRQFQLGFRVTF